MDSSPTSQLSVEDLMSADLPIACSLSASDLSERLAQIAALGDDALLHARNTGAHAELRFRAEPAIRERVEAIVAAESQCCAFLEMAVTDEPDGIALRIAGPKGAELTVQGFVDAFRGLPQTVPVSSVDVQQRDARGP